MKIIAHRGNVSGPNPERENHPDYIDAALALGFEVEIDIRYFRGRWALGHDSLKYPVSRAWLDERADRLWMHCKSLMAIQMALDIPTFHCFWHETDSYTLTSQGYVWTYPGTPAMEKCVLVDLNAESTDRKHLAGICTDYPLRVRGT